jgi:hypothetical protein
MLVSNLKKGIYVNSDIGVFNYTQNIRGLVPFIFYASNAMQDLRNYLIKVTVPFWKYGLPSMSTAFTAHVNTPVF